MIFGIGLWRAKAYSLNFDYENIKISEEHQTKINDIRSKFLQEFDSYEFKYGKEHTPFENRSYVMIYSPSGKLKIYAINKPNNIDERVRNFVSHYNQLESRTRNFSILSRLDSNGSIYSASFGGYYYEINLNSYELGSFDIDNPTDSNDGKSVSRGLQEIYFHGTKSLSVLNLSNYINGVLSMDNYLLYDTTFNLIYEKMSDTDKLGSGWNYVKFDDILINGEVLNSGDSFKSYLDYKSDSNGIKLSKYFANDLDGTEKYIIRADFEKVIDTGLIYQIKVGDNDWQDITSQIMQNALEGFYFYDYDVYWNTEFQARVLYQDGTVKTESSIAVTELSDFDMRISHAVANDLQNRLINVITVDLQNCWNPKWKYEYSYDNKKFYTIPTDSKVFYLHHGIQTFLYFRILDGDKVIYTRDYKEIFTGLIKNIHVREDVTTSEEGEKKIIINVIFNEYSQFDDMYNLKFYINDRELAGSTGAYIIEINEEEYKNFKELNMAVYVDSFLVDSSSYSPKYGGMSFDDKYDQILDDKLNEELGNQDFTTIEGMVESIKNFLNAIREFIVLFFKWIMRFFNGLNIWIRTAIVGEFIIMVICRIIKVVRK